jgi:hypothetical protein
LRIRAYVKQVFNIAGIKTWIIAIGTGNEGALKSILDLAELFPIVQCPVIRRTPFSTTKGLVTIMQHAWVEQGSNTTG